MYLYHSLGILRLVIEQWCLLVSETLVVHIVSNFRWISWTGIFLLSVWTWSLKPFQNCLLRPWIFLSMTRVVFGWREHFVCRVLGNRPFLHGLFGLILGPPFCYLIFLWSLGFRWLLCYHPHHWFPRMVGTFLFPESSLFISNQCWTCTLILVPHGT